VKAHDHRSIAEDLPGRGVRRRDLAGLLSDGRALSASRSSVAPFDFEPDACVLDLASSDDLADRVGD
jgi:hypothetical protein